MKANVYKTYGPPDVVKFQDISKPVPGNQELLVKVMAATVNRTDCGFRSANYFVVRFFSGLVRPKNPVLGCEFAGIVESVGNNVNQFEVGSRVFGFNDSRFGAHAEYMIIAQTNAVAVIPDEVSFEAAAASTEGAHYALCNIRAAKVSAGQNVLVNGATGAIGSAAVQLLKYFGARVTAVCDTKNIELVKSLGADVVIDYTKEDFSLSNQVYDFVFDAVGKSTFSKSKPVMAETGIYISTELGPYFQNPFLALIAPFTGGKRVLFPLPSITREDVEFLGRLVSEGKFKPVIDRYYALNQVVEAYQYVETGMKTGNVVIRVG